MTRHTFTFLGTFVAGALLALVARAAWFDPHADGAHTAPTGSGDHAPMVSNALVPAAAASAKNDPHAGHNANTKKDPHAGHNTKTGKDPHAGHNAETSKDPHAGHSAKEKPAGKTVNTVCPICGMDVDPSLAPAEYKGKLVGFGCKACPPRFKKDPDKWGPYALRNEVREN